MADTRKSGSKASDTSKKGASRNGSRKRLATAAKAGAAIGIGSAALVAALLYANRTKEEDEPAVTSDPRFEPLDS
jgi:hypothetical protein